jgi:hypothetical protein
LFSLISRALYFETFQIIWVLISFCSRHYPWPPMSAVSLRSFCDCCHSFRYSLCMFEVIEPAYLIKFRQKYSLQCLQIEPVKEFMSHSKWHDKVVYISMSASYHNHHHSCSNQCHCNICTDWWTNSFRSLLSSMDFLFQFHAYFPWLNRLFHIVT